MSRDLKTTFSFTCLLVLHVHTHLYFSNKLHSAILTQSIIHKRLKAIWWLLVRWWWDRETAAEEEIVLHKQYL